MMGATHGAASRLADDTAALTAVSRHLHAARTLQVHEARGAERITADQATDALRITRALLSGWAKLMRTGVAPFDLWAGDRNGAWDYERIKTLQAFATAARANVAAAPGAPYLVTIADAIDAMIEHESVYPTARRLVTAEIALPSLIALPVDLASVPAGALEGAAMLTRTDKPQHQGIAA